MALSSSASTCANSAGRGSLTCSLVDKGHQALPVRHRLASIFYNAATCQRNRGLILTTISFRCYGEVTRDGKQAGLGAAARRDCAAQRLAALSQSATASG